MNKFIDYLKTLNLKFSDFNLTENDFDHKTSVHGVNHIYRVMFNVLMLGYKLNDTLNTKRAFMAAYIHDLARTHDYSCDRHGCDSVRVKFKNYVHIFIDNGMKEDDLEAIKLAVSNHSQRHEINRNDPYYKTVAILRDADALDLVRLDYTVRPNLLRFKESVELMKFSEKLFIYTEYKEYKKFIDFLKENINVI
jgi:hypothetical protein